MIEDIRFTPGRGKFLAFASVTFSDSKLVVRGIKILDGQYGPFASFPSEMYKDKEGKTKWKDHCFIVDSDKRKIFQKEIIAAYNQSDMSSDDSSDNSSWNSNEDSDGPAWV